MNAVQTYQTGLSMGEREYYLENDEATAKIRDAFRTHVQKMYQLAGFDEATAKKGMEVVMDVETRLAKAFRSRTELRDPHANYNKMSMEELSYFRLGCLFVCHGLEGCEGNHRRPARFTESCCRYSGYAAH